MSSHRSNRIVVGQEKGSDIEIFYKDWGEGQPIVFSHGWPLNADAWDEQLVFFGEKGYRVIAHDRRGHGRSSQPWTGNDMDSYADDLATLLEALDLQDAILVGHSTGGGEVCRYLARHGSARIAKMVLLGAVPPFMLQTESNPRGIPRSVFEGIRTGVAADRSQFYMDLTLPFFNYNRPTGKVSQGVREAFRIQGMQLGLRGALECVHAFSETDFREDLRKIEIPVLILHGDDDQIVPAEISAIPAAAMLKNSSLKIYPGGSHGLAVTHRDEFHADVLAFIRA